MTDLTKYEHDMAHALVRAYHPAGGFPPQGMDDRAAERLLTLPVMAQIVADAQAEVQRALLSARVVCPVHGIPDCGPLLNGCSIPRYIAEWRGEFLGDLRAVLQGGAK